MGAAIILFLLAIVPFAADMAAACHGDCNDDDAVTVNELVTAVNIALDRAPVDQCRAADDDGDGQVVIAEIVAAVGDALRGCARAERLVAVSRDGRIASLELEAPWTVRASADLHMTIASARCRAGRCLIVHPAPADAISVVAAADLVPAAPIVLEHGADPRDVAFVTDDIVVVSQYGRAALLAIDLGTGARTAIELGDLADGDGLPEALRLASCGPRVFVQLQRVDHGTGVPAAIGATLAVVDFDRPADERVVDADATTPGLQGIALAGRPNFDMPADCPANALYVAEPIPLMQGGGGYERVDLGALTAEELPIATGAEVGGFEIVTPDVYWLITHTEFGPGPSSHLSFFGGTSDTYNTFADEHVNDLALDRDTDQLFFPDPCRPGPVNTSCDGGVQVFHAHTGARATTKAIDVGFPPIEVAVSR